MICRLGLSLGLSALLAAIPLSAQSASISGRILQKDTRTPVANARVVIASGDVTLRSAVTDSAGRYRIAGLVAGRYVLMVTRIGQQLRRMTFDIADAQALTLDLEASPAAERLDEVVTSAS